MALFEAYFDESGCDDGSKILAVGGYLFESDRARRANKKWLQVLRDYDLPFFHMVDCAHHAEPFDKLTKDQCIEVEKRMIDLVKRYATLGFVSLVNPKRFHNNKNEDAYSACVQHCAMAIASMIEANAQAIGAPAKVALFFETGHASGPKANQYLTNISWTDALSRVYSSHTFAKKEEMPLLQAADLLVWQYAKFIKDKVWSTRKPRADFKSLMQHKHHVLYFTAVGENAVIAADEHPSQIQHPNRDKIIMAYFSDDDSAMTALTSQALDPDNQSPTPGAKSGKAFLAQVNWDDLWA
jgi:hypothetical protein